MARPVVWFEVVGQSQEMLRGFYGELFGWRLDFNNPMRYAMVEGGGAGTIPGGIGAYEEAKGGWSTFYVSVDSVEASLEQAQQLGGTVLMPAHTMPDGGVIGVFADPEGHPIGLVALSSAPAQA